MIPNPRPVRPISNPTVTRALAVAGALVLAWLLAPSAAQACCTAVICPYCISSSSNCVCGSQQPVCNVFACNCNRQCGEWTPNPNTGLCYFYPECDTASAQAEAKARWDEVDTNKDGKVSSDESWAWFDKHKAPVLATGLPKDLQKPDTKREDVHRWAFAQVDKNKNGTIEPGEFDSSLAKASSGSAAFEPAGVQCQPGVRTALLER